MPTIETYQLEIDKQVAELLNTPEDLKFLEARAEHYNKVYGERGRKFTNPRLKMGVVPDPSYAYVWERNEHTLYSPMFTVNVVCDEGLMLFQRAFRLTLQQYPHCCGMTQLNGFSYAFGSADPSEDLISRLMAVCINSYKGMGNSCFRLILNMISYPSGSNHGVDRYDLVTDIDPTVERYVSYPHIYSWAKKQKRFREMLMMNPNSSNIMHHIEVIL